LGKLASSPQQQQGLRCLALRKCAASASSSTAAGGVHPDGQTRTGFDIEVQIMILTLVLGFTLNLA
jgi:hypothetical protein